ncbi:MAG: Holliday junction branch migration protein RuvA [Candidatus Dojkabacteria bacterium]
MFGFIKGEVISVYDSKAIILSDKVGYEVNIDNSFVTLGEEAELFIHTVVKESDITLWGFKEFEEKEIFSYLIQVSGVGGKTAYSIISQKGVTGVISAIISEKPNELKVSGVGIKTAQKIILDLKTKVEKYRNRIGDKYRDKNVSIIETNLINEVSEALVSLGYFQRDIDKAFARLKAEYDNINEMQSQEIIKIMLRLL